METKILWINEGEILDRDQFLKITKELQGVATDELGVEIYWWSVTPEHTHYCDIDRYYDASSAMSHLDGWALRSDRFLECANFSRCLVLGEVTDEIRAALASINPHFMNFYGGFAKEKGADVDLSSDIFWSLEGQITNMELFRKAMLILTSKSEAERGSLMHWWCVDEDNHFIVLEQYQDEAAAMAHLDTWHAFSEDFINSTKIDRYNVYSKLSDDLYAAIASLNPECLEFVGGFSK